MIGLELQELAGEVQWDQLPLVVVVPAGVALAAIAALTTYGIRRRARQRRPSASGADRRQGRR